MKSLNPRWKKKVELILESAHYQQQEMWLDTIITWI